MVVPLICYAFLHPEQDLVIALVTQSPRLFEYYVPLVADCEWNEATLLSSVLFSLCHYLVIIVVFLPQVVWKVNVLYCIFLYSCTILKDIWLSLLEVQMSLWQQRKKSLSPE